MSKLYGGKRSDPVNSREFRKQDSSTVSGLRFQPRFRSIPESGHSARIRSTFPARFPMPVPLTYQKSRIQSVSHRFRSGYEARIRPFQSRYYKSNPASNFFDRKPSALCSFLQHATIQHPIDELTYLVEHRNSFLKISCLSLM